MCEKNPMKVVIGIDESGYSEKALNFYIENLHKGSTEIHLAHAVEYPYVPAQRFSLYDCDASGEKADIIGKSMSKAKLVEDKYRRILNEHKVLLKIHTEYSPPGEYICKVAEQEKASMIIVGTRGMGAVRRTILGSVSDYVIHHAHCPVVVVRCYNMK